MTVINLEYWPPISHVAKWYNSTEVQIFTGGTYQKQSFLNRCNIASVQGVLTLSVPLAGGREQKTLFQDVIIDNSQRWAIQHLRTLRSCYGNAAFFDYYFPTIENLLLQRWEHLAVLNQRILNQVVAWLLWKGKVSDTAGFTVPEKQATVFIQPYMQVFADRQPFHPNLSILDLLFCLGPASGGYLGSWSSDLTAESLR